MFLDTNVRLERSGIAYDAQTFYCFIEVESTFKMKCKYIKVRLRCPYNKDGGVEYFRVYVVPYRLVGENQTIGEKAENFVLLKGLNQFEVSSKLPDIPNNIFRQYPDGIGCSLKVTINAKWWLPTQSWLERFTLKPSTPSAAVLNGIERVGETTLDVYDRIRKLF